MTSHPRRTAPLVDADGVRTFAAAGLRRLLWVLVSALGVVAAGTVATILVIRATAKDTPAVAPREAPAPPVASPRGEARTAAAPAAPAAATPATPRPTPRLRPPKTASPAAEPPSIDAKEVIERLQAAGERGGIAAFPVPGTKPVKPGIVVPDDFELPPGYVRHYQSTDDGRQLPPVLMFHPDFEFVDAGGAAVALPEDRIVPPELAPPGLPIRMLDVPEPPGARRPSP